MEMYASTLASNDLINANNREHLEPLADDGGLKVVVVRGPAGSGKSSLVKRLVIEDVLQISLCGQAKFDPGDPTPYSAIVSML
jgi:putative ribosome biogenesis GTPase RsgA